jgi:hypothetical protein
MLNILHRQTTTYHPEATGAVERLHHRLKAVLCAKAAMATWAEEIPWVLLGLPSQSREDTGLSPAEAVFGTPLVVTNEILQAKEFSIDKISKKISLVLDAPVFSLPSKHNSGRQLSEELPGDLLCTPLIWVHCSGIILPLQWPYDGPYAILRHGPRSVTIRVRARDNIVSISPTKPCTDADAETGSP